MNIYIKEIVKKYNINQIYVSNDLCSNKNIFLKGVNYEEYNDKSINTLFIGLYAVKDFKTIISHRNGVFILWINKNNNYVLVNSIKHIGLHFCIEDSVFDNLNNIIPDIIFNEKNIDIIPLDITEFINVNNIDFIYLNPKSQYYISYKSKNKYLNEYNVIFFGIYTKNDIILFNNHIENKYVYWDEVNTKVLNNIKILNNVSMHLVSDYSNYILLKKYCDNLTLVRNFEVNSIEEYIDNYHFKNKKTEDIKAKKIENKVIKKEHIIKNDKPKKVENKNLIKKEHIIKNDKPKKVEKDNLIKLIKKELIVKNDKTENNYNLVSKKNHIIKNKKIEKLIRNENIIKSKDEFQNKIIKNKISKGKKYVQNRVIKNKILKKKKFKKFLDENIKNKLPSSKTIEKIKTNKISKDIDFIKYPILFHKYKYNISNPNNKIDYDVINNKVIDNELFAHLHCYDIRSFFKFYGNYIELIESHFSIIITYSIGSYDPKLNKFTIIRCPNKGMDIGAKFICIDFLKKNNINYKYILFLHSKTCENKRYLYYNFILNKISNFLDKIKHSDSVGAFVPPLLLNGDTNYYLVNYKFMNYSSNVGWKNKHNFLYMNDIINYLDLSDELFLFPEGNCYILKKEVIDYIFTDLKIYNLLNDDKSFDLSWVKTVYNLSYSNDKIYNMYIQNDLIPNNLAVSKDHKLYKADCMIEHVFERLIFLVVKKLNLEVNILFNYETKNCYKNCNLLINYFIKTNKFYTNKNFLSQLNNYNNILIIACHSNSKLKIDTLIGNLSYFLKLSNNIVIINSLEFKSLNLENKIKKICKNIKLNFVYIKNNCYLCQGKWFYYLSTINFKKYNNVILTNDSYKIIKSLVDFRNLWLGNREMTTLLVSNEKKYHATDFLRRYNKNGIEKIYNFYKEHINYKENISFDEVINKFEIESTYIFKSFNYAYIENDPVNINFDSKYFYDYIVNKNYPIIKIKKIQRENCQYFKTFGIKL